MKSFVIPIFSQLVSPNLVLGEHFVLKDLTFYEVAQLVDVEYGKPNRMHMKKKNCQKRTLHQAPTSFSHPSLSSAPWPTKERSTSCLVVCP